MRWMELLSKIVRIGDSHKLGTSKISSNLVSIVSMKNSK